MGSCKNTAAVTWDRHEEMNESESANNAYVDANVETEQYTLDVREKVHGK